MRGSFLRSIALGIAATCLTAGTAAAQWGTLKGQFVYDGKAPAPEKIQLEICRGTVVVNVVWPMSGARRGCAR